MSDDGSRPRSQPVSIDAGPDVCIVGAGLAGGLLAHTLAQRGCRVVVIEAGPRFSKADRLGALGRRLSHGEPPWPRSEARDRFTNDGETAYPLNDYRVKGVGGTTLHWSAYTPRFHADDFRLRARYGIAADWPVGYAELESYYASAEASLGVSGLDDNPFASPRSSPYKLPAFPFSYGDGIMGRACERAGVRVHHTPYARSWVPFGDRPGCLAFSTCSSLQICPIGAQYTAESHVEMAEATGLVTVMTDARVRRIETSADGQVEAVVVRLADGRETRQAARFFVLAAHAVETARLLLLSANAAHPDGLANRSGLVGCHFMEHPLWALEGRIKANLQPYRIGFHTMDSHQFCSPEVRNRDGGFRLAFPNQHGPWPGEVASLSGNWGNDLAAEIQDTFGHHPVIHAFIEQLPDLSNRVTLDPDVTDDVGDPVPRITYAIGDYERNSAERALVVMHRILEALGAEDVRKTLGDGFGFCGHQIGTCRMGDDPSQSVVDRHLFCHDTTNLQVVGSAVFPTGTPLNPSLTIAALALRAAEAVLDRL